MVSTLLLLVPALLGWALLLRSTRPLPSVPWLSEIAYREHRQCYGGCYSGWASPPERCAYPEDHYGGCRP